MESESTTMPIDEALRQRVIDAICELLPRSLKQEMPDLSADTRLNELALSSVGMVGIMLTVEETLEIQVDIEDFEDSDLETIGRLATYVAGHSLVG
jgi:acyl carrier protein